MKISFVPVSTCERVITSTDFYRRRYVNIYMCVYFECVFIMYIWVEYVRILVHRHVYYYLTCIRIFLQIYFT